MLPSRPVDILVVNVRGGSQRHWGLDAARRHAADLCGAGHEVRWLCPHPPGVLPEDVSGVERRDPPGHSAPYRRVAGSLSDTASELELSRWLRERPADEVHLFGHGVAGSANLIWIADRMGSPVTVWLRADEVLCHRGNLVDGWGEPCREWSDERRCLRCVLRGGGGLKPAAALLGRVFGWLGGLSPWPSRHGFWLRGEVVLGGLLVAREVVVQSERERALVEEAGATNVVVAATSP